MTSPSRHITTTSMSRRSSHLPSSHIRVPRWESDLHASHLKCRNTRVLLWNQLPVIGTADYRPGVNESRYISRKPVRNSSIDQHPRFIIGYTSVKLNVIIRVQKTRSRVHNTSIKTKVKNTLSKHVSPTGAYSVSAVVGGLINTLLCQIASRGGVKNAP